MVFTAVEKLGNFRMYFYRKPVAHHILGFGGQIPVNFVADGFARQQVAVSITVKTGFTKGPGQIAAGAFARHLNQTKFRKRENICLAFIFFHGFVHLGHDLVLVGGFTHVNEVNDNDAADIAQPDLVGNLLDCFQVGFQDGFIKVAFPSAYRSAVSIATLGRLSSGHSAS